MKPPPPNPFEGMQKMEVKIRNLTPQLKVKVYFSPPFTFLIKVFMFLKTTLFFLSFSNCQDFLDVAVNTFKNDTMLRAWLFYI